ncbi:MAG: ribonuclease P protein component [Bacteroidales bacterium]|nr:ribonuclease P protein component [Bacteroidales bacterium]
MVSAGPATLSKEQIVRGKTSIDRLVSGGRWITGSRIKCCYLHPGGAEVSRILVSVPKKFFKRAVKRNLLKRRMRESYRLQKSLLAGCEGCLDLMFVYNSAECASFDEIKEDVRMIMEGIAEKLAEK